MKQVVWLNVVLQYEFNHAKYSLILFVCDDMKKKTNRVIFFIPTN